MYARVQARGQITLPCAVRKLAGIKPGDRLMVLPGGPGKIRLEVVPRMSLAEMAERWSNREPADRVDWPTLREQAEDDAARELFEAMARNTPDFEPPARG